jgi:DNA-binding winged helix-turn-helix (wHTH) protein
MVITKEVFLNHLYGGIDEPEMKIIDVFVCKLRKKLSQLGEKNIISTVWGRGYSISEKLFKTGGCYALDEDLISEKAVGRLEEPLVRGAI